MKFTVLWYADIRPRWHPCATFMALQVTSVLAAFECFKFSSCPDISIRGKMFRKFKYWQEK